MLLTEEFAHQTLLKVKEDLQKSLGREPTESELAEGTKMNPVQVRRTMEVGRAARNKLIKVTIWSSFLRDHLPHFGEFLASLQWIRL